jgi:hypothetical protein
MKKTIIKLALASLALLSFASHAVTIVSPTFTYNGHQYNLLSSTNSWTDSEAFAIAQGGHLVAINDSAEMAFLNSTFGTNALWIGLARTSPTSFAWTNGDALAYTNWQGGEPNNAGGNENYVHTYANLGTWNDLSNNSGYAGAKFGVLELAAIPEPSELALMFAGLGIMGFMFRRRQSGK